MWNLYQGVNETKYNIRYELMKMLEEAEKNKEMERVARLEAEIRLLRITWGCEDVNHYLTNSKVSRADEENDHLYPT